MVMLRGKWIFTKKEESCQQRAGPLVRGFKDRDGWKEILWIERAFKTPKPLEASERRGKLRIRNWLLAPLSLLRWAQPPKVFITSPRSAVCDGANRKGAADGGRGEGEEGMMARRRLTKPRQVCSQGLKLCKTNLEHYPRRSPLKILSPEAQRDHWRKEARLRDLRGSTVPVKSKQHETNSSTKLRTM